MNGEERNNREFEQHRYGGIVQGIPVVDNPSAPPLSATSNNAPPPQPVASTVSGDLPATAIAPTNATATAVINNSTTVVVNPGPPIIELKDDSLPCGCGTGWFMFIIGWFFGIPWYVGACILICGKIDPRERPGHIACGPVLLWLVFLLLRLLLPRRIMQQMVTETEELKK